MTTRKKLIVGNWKMNLNTHEASLYVHKLAGLIPEHRDIEVVLAPTLLALQTLSLQINRRQFKLAVQNFYWQDNGPYTGEVSAAQLHGIVDYAIIGHSERRHIFHENDKDIRSKVQAALRNHIKPILCIGETASERADNETHAVIHDQLLGGLANVTSDELDQVVVAYEPIWAISNGTDYKNHKIVTPEDAEKVAKIIRRQIASLYGKDAADAVKILYGASTNSQNAASFLQLKDIDGLLVGGASLNAHEFSEVVNSAHSVSELVKK